MMPRNSGAAARFGGLGLAAAETGGDAPQAKLASQAADANTIGRDSLFINFFLP
jgi:hypothetical protein